MNTKLMNSSKVVRAALMLGVLVLAGSYTSMSHAVVVCDENQGLRDSFYGRCISSNSSNNNNPYAQKKCFNTPRGYRCIQQR